MFQNGRPGSARGCDSKVKGQSLRCMRDNPDYVEIVLEQLAVPQLMVSGTIVSWSADGHASGYEVSIDGIVISDPEITMTQGICSFDVASVRNTQSDDRKYSIRIVALGDGVAYKNSESSSVEVTIPGTGVEFPKEYVYDKDGTNIALWQSVHKHGCARICVRRNLQTVRKFLRHRAMTSRLILPPLM